MTGLNQRPILPDAERLARNLGPEDMDDPVATLDPERAATEAAERELRRRQRLHQLRDEEVLRIEARDAARLIVEQRRASQQPVPAGLTLTELLAMPIEPTRYRIEGLWPRRGNIVFSAAYKSGKTTTRDNVTRCFADGGKFLGLYHVEPVEDGKVGVVDLEMSENKLQEWFRDQNIHNTDRVHLWPMRGRARTFDLLTEAIRCQWVEKIKAAAIRVLIVDCLGPILSALGRNENDQKDVGPVLDALATTVEEAGVEECMLIHHMGHNAERSRGASRLRDWPDAEWRLVRQKDPDNPLGDPDPAAPRFFSAFGRDVNVREGQLVYDVATRRLLYADGNRKEARSQLAVGMVLRYVKDNPRASVRAIQAAADKVDGVSRDMARDAAKSAVDEGLLVALPGDKRSKLHTLTASGYAYLAGPPDDDLEPQDPFAPMIACRVCFTPIDPDEAIRSRSDLCPRCQARS